MATIRVVIGSADHDGGRLDCDAPSRASPNRIYGKGRRDAARPVIVCRPPSAVADLRTSNPQSTGEWQQRSVPPPGRSMKLEREMSTLNVSIRQELARDHDCVYRLVYDAFSRAEHTNHEEQDLVVRLRGSAAFVPELALVAEVAGDVVGHILFTRAVIRDGARDHASLVLAPLAVAPGLQRKGIGARLVDAGHRIARDLGFASSVLVGHPTYYPRFGYRPAESFGIVTHLDLPPGVFMACELRPGGLAGVRGMVIYAPEFGLDPPN
jgi:predicted N-acetyltransferase YhbS